MNFLSDALGYIFTASNWTGHSGLGVRIGEHLQYTAIAVLAAVIIAVPIGLIIGHTGRGTFLVVSAVNALRALPTLGVLLLGVLLAWGSAVQAAEKEAAKPAEFQATTHTIQATGKAQFELQAALINAVPGDVIELAAGKYDFTSELNVVCDNVTLRGAGRDKTVINFKKQSAGSSGLLATGNAFVIEGLTIQDTVGSGIKVLGAQDVIFRDVKVEWTEGEK